MRTLTLNYKSNLTSVDLCERNLPMYGVSIFKKSP